MSDHPASTTDFHLRDLSRDDWDELARVVGAFAEALRCGERPEIADLLPARGSGLRRAVLVEMIQEELECRLKAGEFAHAGEYLARFPELADDPDAARDLVRAEERLRQSSAQAPAIEGRQLGRFEVLEERGRGALGLFIGAWMPNSAESWP